MWEKVETLENLTENGIPWNNFFFPFLWRKTRRAHFSAADRDSEGLTRNASAKGLSFTRRASVLLADNRSAIVNFFCLTLHNEHTQNVAYLEIER